MDAKARAERALDDALIAVSESASVSTIVRAALRVATLRQDPLAEFWLSAEVLGIKSGTSSSEAARDALSRLVALVGAKEAEAQRLSVFETLMSRRKTQDAKESIVSFGVSELETFVASMQAIYDDSVTPGMTPLDTGIASLRQEKEKAAVYPLLLQQKLVLERIKDAAYRYLLEVESEMLAGVAVPDVIAQGQSFVESELSILAPEALRALSAAQERLAQGDTEAMSHAATSSRRAIKALADVLCPPGDPIVDGSGVIRVMDDDHYRNRLVEYVRQRMGRSTHADVLASNITTLGTRLKSLDDLASKGVHSELSRTEADSCVSWTYMLAADLLRVEEESRQPKS